MSRNSFCSTYFLECFFSQLCVIISFPTTQILTSCVRAVQRLDSDTATDIDRSLAVLVVPLFLRAILGGSNKTDDENEEDDFEVIEVGLCLSEFVNFHKQVIRVVF